MIQQLHFKKKENEKELRIKNVLYRAEFIEEDDINENSNKIDIVETESSNIIVC